MHQLNTYILNISTRVYHHNASNAAMIISSSSSSSSGENGDDSKMYKQPEYTSISSLSLPFTLPSCLFNITSPCDLNDTSNFPFGALNNIWTIKPVSEIVWKSILVFFIVSVGLVGNFCVIFLILKRPKIRQLPVNIFIVNLAVADFLTTLFTPITSLLTNIYQNYELGPVMCKLDIFVKMMCILASIFSVVAISFQRFLNINHPNSIPITRRTRSSTLIGLIFIWIAAILLAMPLALWRAYRERPWKDYLEKWCADDPPTYSKNYWIFLMSPLIYIPLIVMIVVYSMMIVEINAFIRKLQQTTGINSTDHSLNSSSSTSSSSSNSSIPYSGGGGGVSKKDDKRLYDVSKLSPSSMLQGKLYKMKQLNKHQKQHKPNTNNKNNDYDNTTNEDADYYDDFILQRELRKRRKRIKMNSTGTDYISNELLHAQLDHHQYQCLSANKKWLEAASNQVSNESKSKTIVASFSSPLPLSTLKKQYQMAQQHNKADHLTSMTLYRRNTRSTQKSSSKMPRNNSNITSSTSSSASHHHHHYIRSISIQTKHPKQTTTTDTIDGVGRDGGGGEANKIAVNRHTVNASMHKRSIMITIIIYCLITIILWTPLQVLVYYRAIKPKKAAMACWYERTKFMAQMLCSLNSAINPFVTFRRTFAQILRQNQAKRKQKLLQQRLKENYLRLANANGGGGGKQQLQQQQQPRPTLQSSNANVGVINRSSSSSALVVMKSLNHSPSQQQPISSSSLHYNNSLPIRININKEAMKKNSANVHKRNRRITFAAFNRKNSILTTDDDTSWIDQRTVSIDVRQKEHHSDDSGHHNDLDHFRSLTLSLQSLSLKNNDNDKEDSPPPSLPPSPPQSLTLSSSLPELNLSTQKFESFESKYASLSSVSVDLLPKLRKHEHQDVEMCQSYRSDVNDENIQQLDTKSITTLNYSTMMNNSTESNHKIIIDCNNDSQNTLSHSNQSSLVNQCSGGKPMIKDNDNLNTVETIVLADTHTNISSVSSGPTLDTTTAMFTANLTKQVLMKYTPELFNENL